MSSSENDSNDSEDQFEDEQEDTDSEVNEEEGSEEGTDQMSDGDEEDDEDESDDENDEGDESDEEDGDGSEEEDSEYDSEDQGYKVDELMKKKSIKTSANNRLKEKQSKLSKLIGSPKKEAAKEKAKTTVMGKNVKAEIKSPQADKAKKNKVSNEKSSAKDTEHSKAVESKQTIPFNQMQKELEEKYQKRKGKSLFLRFSKRLPTEPEQIVAMLKEHCPLVLKVRRPRQPAARFCLADFHSTEDCRKAMKQLRKVTIDGKHVVVTIPKTDSDDFIEELVEKRKRRMAENRAKKKLKKSFLEGEERAPKIEKTYTATLIIRNIPSSASVEEIKSHFPHAVEFKLNYAKPPQTTNSATVTLPTPKDATVARRQKISIGDNQLTVSFSGQRKKPKKQANKPTKILNTTANEPIPQSSDSKQDSAKPVANGKNKRKKEKRKAVSVESETPIPPKKIKTEIVSPVKHIKVEANGSRQAENVRIKSELKIKKEIKTEQGSEVNARKADNAGNTKAKFDKSQKHKNKSSAKQKIGSPSNIVKAQNNQTKMPKSKFENKHQKEQKMQQNRALGKKNFKGASDPGENIEEKFSIGNDLKKAQLLNKGKHQQQGFTSQKLKSKKGEFGGKKKFNKKGSFHAKSMRP